jgi:glycosyltransferase involved in cell wall biosynthesis
VTDVSVIVPARDAAATLGPALEALGAQRLNGSYEVIVVDDGSADGTAELAAGAPGEVKVIRQGRQGPAAARNRGARAASGAALAFTDADCVPAPGWLAAGLRALRDAELVQGAVRPDPATPQGPFDRTLWVVRETGLYETANLFVARGLFERVGGFVEWLEPRHGKAMAEDVWLGWRVRRAGGRSAFCPDALVHHAVFPRGGLGYVAERRRLEHFPEIAALVPELRRSLFFARVFLSRDSAAFDAALCASALALRSRSRVPLAAALPYAWTLLRRSAPWRRQAPRVALVELAADATAFASLARGSVRRRALVI